MYGDSSTKRSAADPKKRKSFCIIPSKEGTYTWRNIFNLPSQRHARHLRHAEKGVVGAYDHQSTKTFGDRRRMTAGEAAVKRERSKTDVFDVFMVVSAFGSFQQGRAEKIRRRFFLKGEQKEKQGGEGGAGTHTLR